MHISSDQKFSFRRPFIPQKVKKKPTLQEMASKGLNPNSSAVRRIMKELKELELNPSSEYTASPLEQNIFEWHFTIRGPEDTSFAGGRYHGRILLPSEYPFKPPDIMLITVISY